MIKYLLLVLIPLTVYAATTSIKDNVLKLGAKDSQDIFIYANNGSATPPYLQFDFSANEWVFSDVNVNFTGSASVANDLTMNGTGVLKLPEGTTAQQPTGADGMIRFNSDLDRYEGFKESTSAWGELGGGGQGGINYLNVDTDNSTFDISVNDWVAFNDGSVSVPVDGTGGTPTAGFTCTRNTTTPIRGDGDLQITTPAASDTQGEGCSVDFDIDKGMQAQKLTIELWDDLSNANLNDDEFAVFIYDRTNANIIRVNGEDLKGGEGRAFAQFQTASNSTAYRLIIMNVDATNTTARNLYFDQIAVSPTNLARGNIITDWEDFTPTGSWTTNNTYTGKYRRIGDSAEIFFEASLSGAPNSTFLTFNLPSGLTIDTSKIEITGRSVIGSARISDVSGRGYPAVASYLTDTSFLVYHAETTGNASSFVTEASPITFASGDTITASIKVPIVGWSSDAVQSSDLGGREIVTNLLFSGSASIAGGDVKIAFSSSDVVDDTSAAFDDAADRINIKEAGYYDITAYLEFSNSLGTTNTLAIQVYKNGVFIPESAHESYGGTTPKIQSTLTGVKLNKGDYIELYSGHDDTSLTLAKASLKVAKRSSPQTILETETVAARYTSNNGQTINPTQSVFEFEDLDYDSHSAFSGTVFTVPVSGKYEIKAKVASAFTAYSVGNILGLKIQVNGSNIALTETVIEVTRSDTYHVNISDTLNLNKGDTVEIDCQSGTTTTATTTAGANFFSIARIK